MLLKLIAMYIVIMFTPDKLALNGEGALFFFFIAACSANEHCLSHNHVVALEVHGLIGDLLEVHAIS